MAKTSKQNFLGGAAILTAAVILVKIISACYKIPLGNLLGDEGMCHFYAAYNIYNVLLTVSTAGLPLAISKLVAAARTEGRLNQAHRYFSVGMRLFLLLGAVGSALMFFCAGTFAALLHDTLAFAPIRALSMSVLCVCIMSAVRGYTQGQNNMLPSGISQVIEALFKLCFGLAAAWLLLQRGSALPIAAAGAISGVTVGTAVAMVYLLCWMLLHRRDDPPGGDVPDRDRTLLRRILVIGVPITFGAASMSILSLLDQGVVLWRLQSALGLSETAAGALYGQYTFSQNLYNLPSSFIPPITMSLIPSVSAALAARDKRTVNRIVSASMRLIALFALPAGAGLSVLARPILHLLYPAQWEAAEAAVYHLQILGVASIFVSLMLLSNAILQAFGRERIPIYTMLIGGVVKLGIIYVLTADPAIGVKSAPISTIFCYALIAALNLGIVRRISEEKPRYLALFFRPVLCTLCMAAAAGGSYQLLSAHFGSAVSTLAAILLGILVYAVSVFALRVIRSEDILLLPKGEKIAKILRLH